MDNLNQRVLKNIRQIRKDKGISQEFLANKLGFDTANYSRIESGKQDLKIKHLEIIANELDCDVTFIFTYPEKFVSESSKGFDISVNLKANDLEQMKTIVEVLKSNGVIK